MKPTKRQSDPLGRSTTRQRYSPYLLSLAIAITGSVWPIQARSIEPIFDSFGPPRLGTREITGVPGRRDGRRRRASLASIFRRAEGTHRACGRGSHPPTRPAAPISPRVRHLGRARRGGSAPAAATERLSPCAGRRREAKVSHHRDEGTRQSGRLPPVSLRAAPQHRFETSEYEIFRRHFRRLVTHVKRARSSNLPGLPDPSQRDILDVHTLHSATVA
jgi:hypothetical protein